MVPSIQNCQSSYWLIGTPSITLQENLQPDCSLAGAHAPASIVSGHHCLRRSHKAKATVRHHSQARARVFNTGDNVLTRDYRAADRWAHGTITARNGPLSYTIQTSPGIVWRRHADQIVHTQPGATDPDHTQPGATDPDHTQPGATDPDLILPISLPKDTTRSQSAEPYPVTVPPPAPTVASTSASPSNLGTQPRRSGRITKPPVKLNL